jgi:hypothetical protein
LAWETRRDRTYYYRKQRIGARVRSIYVGTRESARAMADQDAATRSTARARRQDEDAGDAVMDALEHDIAALLSCTLLAEGYHTHKGTWRLRRPPCVSPDAAAPRPRP